MSNVLFITKSTHQGNRMFDPDEIKYAQQIINTNIKTLDVFCEQVIEALKENYENASNFQEEIKTIASQFENNNFAQVDFQFASSTYTVTIVAPKFE